MGRGKIEIKRIENPTNRQVTYSKRRNGIFKKAEELTVLCDAKVSIIMFSNSGKCHEYISPSITTKQVYDEYQKVLGVDLWNSQYEKMQEELQKLRETNRRLRRKIRQRMGDDLGNLNMGQLIELQQEVADSLAIVQERKYHKIRTQTDTCRKKVNNLEKIYGSMVMNMEAGYEEYGGNYDNSPACFPHGGGGQYGFSHPNVQPHEGYESHDLRLG